MRLATLGLTTLLLATSCQDACWTEDYAFTWHGRNVTVYGYDLTEADACGGSFAEIDGHTGMIMKALGVDGPAHYTFRWVSQRFWADTNDVCSPTALACMLDGEVRSRSLPNMHEMVHLVNRSVAGGDGCPSVLDEGLAMYYDGPSPLWDLYPSADAGIEPLLTAERIPSTPAAYIRAGHFASFLVERFGPVAVIELCNSIPRRSTSSAWDAAARGTLGVSLEELLADYERYPACDYQQYRARLWGCTGEPDFIFSPQETQFVVETGCSDPQATNGDLSTLGDAVLLRRVYFEEDTWVEVSAESEGDSGVGATYMSLECVRCSDDPQMFVELDDSDIQLFRAGLHEVSVFFDKRDPIRLSMKAVQ